MFYFIFLARLAKVYFLSKTFSILHFFDFHLSVLSHFFVRSTLKQTLTLLRSCSRGRFKLVSKNQVFFFKLSSFELDSDSHDLVLDGQRK